MEYVEAIENAFKLYDEIENEICIFSRINDSYTEVKNVNGSLIVKADCRIKEFEAEIVIEREEIIQRVLGGMTPKAAICQLLKEKICLSAHEFEK